MKLTKEHQEKMAEGRRKSKKFHDWLKKLHQSNKGKRYSPATEFKKGMIPSNFNGGTFINAHGYVWVLRKVHPNANAQGYVKLSRLVMEDRLGRYLTSKEIVHHINGIRNDDRIENLMLVSRATHAKLHDNKRGKNGQFNG